MNELTQIKKRNYTSCVFLFKRCALCSLTAMCETVELAAVLEFNVRQTGIEAQQNY
jgi:hypothetical protein